MCKTFQDVLAFYHYISVDKSIRSGLGSEGVNKRDLQPGTHFVQNIRLHALNSTELFTILHGDVDTLDAECLQLDYAKHS